MVDFRQDEVPKLQGCHSFKVCRSGVMNGIGLWFDADLAPGVSLSSGPWARNHWKQCFAPITMPITVSASDRVSVDISMQLRTKEQDSFNFIFEIEKES